MPVSFHEGDLFQADAEALVNPVNCVGVMGKGLALQFKKAYPEMFESYRMRCSKGALIIGEEIDVHLVRHDGEGVRSERGGRWVMNFPTKNHWRDPSRIEWIEAGLTVLSTWLHVLSIRSVAIPALGCGAGGLRWEDVQPLIEAWAPLNVDVQIYGPKNGDK